MQRKGIVDSLFLPNTDTDADADTHTQYKKDTRHAHREEDGDTGSQDDGRQKRG